MTDKAVGEQLACSRTGFNEKTGGGKLLTYDHSSSVIPHSSLVIGPAVLRLIDQALEEDSADRDITTCLTVPLDVRAEGRIVAKSAGVIAGLCMAEAVFRRIDPDLSFSACVEEGEEVAGGTMVATVAGPARSILSAERTALNFLGHLSGIATKVRRMTQRLAGTRARLVDTRKTLPGLRLPEKWAVRMGGGCNHRFGLADGILIKDNHIAAAGGVAQAVRAARAGAPHPLRVEVEVKNLVEVEEALQAGADILLLDNMDLPTLARAVECIKSRALIEVSGNVNEENIAEIAALGVDFISSGAITHSAAALDVSMQLTVASGS